MLDNLRLSGARTSLWLTLDWVLLFAAVTLGTLLASLPHVATLLKTGTLEFLADGDDIYYLAIARHPYYGEPELRDPFCGEWEKVPALFAWLQFVPLTKLASWMGIPLLKLNLLWRLVGGAMLGSSLFLLFRTLFGALRSPRAWAVLCTVVCLADVGFVSGKTIIDTVLLVPHLLRGTTPMEKADAFGQFRVVTPLLNLPFVLLFVACLTPSFSAKWKRALLGGILLGLCILLYFYFWTAAVLTAAALIVVNLCLGTLWSRQRPEAFSEARVAAAALLIGLGIGAPQIYANSRTLADPPEAVRQGMDRQVKGITIPKGHSWRYVYVVNYWVLAKLSLGGLFILVFRNKALIPLWIATLSGYVLANSAIITGLEFENFHWSYIHATMGQILLLGAIASFLDRISIPSRYSLGGFAIVTASLFLIAVLWRPFEAIHAPEAVQNNNALESLRPLRPTLSGLDQRYTLAGPVEARVAILFSDCGLLYEMPYTIRLLISDDEVHERHALNSWLQGVSESDYSQSGADDFIAVPLPIPISSDRTREAVAQTRSQIFRRLTDPDFADSLLRKYRIRYLLAPAVAPNPHRGGTWLKVSHSRQWALWQLVSTNY